MPTKFLRLVAAALLLLTSSRLATAQTNITQSVVLDPPSLPFIYTPFTVATGGTFNLFTMSVDYPDVGAPNDPTSFLFSGFSFNGAGLGALLAANEDGEYACGSSNFTDPCIAGFALAPGNYTFATALFGADEDAARSNTSGAGYYDDTGPHNVDIRIMSEDGIAIEGTSAPEPASVLLLATGLIGMMAIGRSRRGQSQERSPSTLTQ